MLRGLKPKLEVHHGGELLSFRQGWSGVTLLILAALLLQSRSLMQLWSALLCCRTASLRNGICRTRSVLQPRGARNLLLIMY